MGDFVARVRASLVLATALVAGIAPVALGGAPAVAAPVAARSGATVEPGTVVQEGGRLTVPAGVEGPVTLRFKATLPTGVTGPVRARVTLPITNWPPGGWTDHRAAAQIDSTCSVGGGAFAACDWQGTSFTDDPGPYRIVLDLPPVEASSTVDHAVTIDLPESLAWIGSLDAPVELKDAAGTVVAQGKVGLDVVAGSPRSSQWGAVHAVDKDGVLWRYEATGKADRTLTPRKRIGGGWNAYDRIVPLNRATAAGTGDLVARDKNGHLWYYEGSGNPAAPFKPARRTTGDQIGRWQEYTSLASNGEGGLVARDKDGVLWNFERSDEEGISLFEPRVRVGGGWNVYTQITAFGDGLVARDTAGVLWKYNGSTSTSAARPFEARWRVGGGWNTYNTLAGTAELGAGTHTELIARSTNGDLWAYDARPSGFGYAPSSLRTRIGWGWSIYKTVI
ncbi:tachylectin-related carbohydrate-binding protein [Streptomyces exfoliatus]|uniref:tachylectin-related carbohydrate-binding protein n=1 Tax=Streptomyces exfoliatus TaxID=1905 RepID=UPI0004CBE974|nr:tachylectin-related carbohydrate-binding protein [Streptomyces exfoliatus]